MVDAQCVISAVVCTLTAGIVLGSEKQQPDEKWSSPEGLSSRGRGDKSVGAGGTMGQPCLWQRCAQGGMVPVCLCSAAHILKPLMPCCLFSPYFPVAS